MKQVAGKLRGDLQQYRELLTFAQFGTELDRISQAQLDRGERLTEILKQNQYVPLPVEQQILIIYAGNRGFLDEFPVGKIKEYEQELYEFMGKEHPDVIRAIAEKKAIDGTLDETIASAIQEFNAQFKEEVKEDRQGKEIQESLEDRKEKEGQKEKEGEKDQKERGKKEGKQKKGKKPEKGKISDKKE
jgi:F-type H+-transporting ATPase subunit alpha